MTPLELRARLIFTRMDETMVRSRSVLPVQTYDRDVAEARDMLKLLGVDCAKASDETLFALVVTLDFVGGVLHHHGPDRGAAENMKFLCAIREAARAKGLQT